MRIAHGSAGVRPETHAAEYIGWVRSTEDQLRSIFWSPEVVGRVRTPAYWSLLNASVQHMQIVGAVNRELEDQARWLDQLVDEVRSLEQLLDAAPGPMALLDTHVLLHYLPPDQISWSEVLKVKTARLVVPLRIIEEMDEKKYTAGRQELRDSARAALSQLWTFLQPTKGGPAPLPRGGVTIEAWIDDGVRDRPLDADSEVLAVCELLHGIGKKVVLVTGDVGMSLRAMRLDVEVANMPDKYRRRRS